MVLRGNEGSGAGGIGDSGDYCWALLGTTGNWVVLRDNRGTWLLHGTEQ